MILEETKVNNEIVVQLGWIDEYYFPPLEDEILYIQARNGDVYEVVVLKEREREIQTIDTVYGYGEARKYMQHKIKELIETKDVK